LIAPLWLAGWPWGAAVHRPMLKRCRQLGERNGEL
jgi:hypothetical protein